MSVNTGSYIDSRISLRTPCTSLSWKLGIPKDLSLPSGLGIYVLLISPHLNFELRTATCSALMVLREVPSIVCLSTPVVKDPGLVDNF